MKDLLTGLLFLSIGIVFAVASSHLYLGMSAEMGPGYFPLLVSSVLIIIGLALAIKNLWKY